MQNVSFVSLNFTFDLTFVWRQLHTNIYQLFDHQLGTILLELISLKLLVISDWLQLDQHLVRHLYSGKKRSYTIILYNGKNRSNEIMLKINRKFSTFDWIGKNWVTFWHILQIDRFGSAGARKISKCYTSWEYQFYVNAKMSFRQCMGSKCDTFCVANFGLRDGQNNHYIYIFSNTWSKKYACTIKSAWLKHFWRVWSILGTVPNKNRLSNRKPQMNNSMSFLFYKNRKWNNSANSYVQPTATMRDLNMICWHTINKFETKLVFRS